MRGKVGINLNFYNEESNLYNNWEGTPESPFILLSGEDNKENLNRNSEPTSQDAFNCDCQTQQPYLAITKRCQVYVFTDLPQLTQHSPPSSCISISFVLLISWLTLLYNEIILQTSPPPTLSGTDGARWRSGWGWSPSSTSAGRSTPFPVTTSSTRTLGLAKPGTKTASSSCRGCSLTEPSKVSNWPQVTNEH